jgi:GntR family transcriptional repressor for pyruvate dehydrogenase complex
VRISPAYRSIGDAPELGGLQPIESPTRVYEVVTEAICGYIAQAGLSPGDRIPSERDLAARLRVSRASVGKAMTELRVTGLVEIRHGDGAYLIRSLEAREPAGAEEAADESAHPHLNEVRLLLESRATRLAAQRRAAPDLEDLRGALRQMRDEVADGDVGLNGNRSFHLAIWRASHNPVLLELLTGLGGRLDRLAELSLSRPGQAESCLEMHERIYDAIATADPDLAEELMQTHLRITDTLTEANGHTASK